MLVNITIHLERTGFIRASTPLACASNALAQIKLPAGFTFLPITTRVEHIPTGMSTLFDHQNLNDIDRRELTLLPDEKPHSTVLRFISGQVAVADVKVICKDEAARWYFPRWRKLWENGLIDSSFNLDYHPHVYPELPVPEPQDPRDVNAPVYNTTTTFAVSTDIEITGDHRAAAARAISMLSPDYTVIACETSSPDPYSSAYVFHRFGHAFDYIDNRAAPVLIHQALNAFRLTFEFDGAPRGNFLFPVNYEVPHVLQSLLPQLARLWSTGFISSP